MVDPKEEIYKRHFAASSFFTLIFCIISQIALSRPLSYIPIISIIVLSFGYIWGKWNMGAWSLGAFISSLGALVYFYLSGSSVEAIAILTAFSAIILGILIALPAEEDWEYIRGWKKNG